MHIETLFTLFQLFLWAESCIYPWNSWTYHNQKMCAYLLLPRKAEQNVVVVSQFRYINAALTVTFASFQKYEDTEQQVCILQNDV